MNAADQEIARLKRELDETKQALEDAQSQIQGANRLKAQFLATMSHELRTPMNAILGFTRLVLRRGSEQLSNRNRENLEKVKLSADHLLALINDILDLSKIEAGRVEIVSDNFDLQALLQSCSATVGPALGKAGVDLVVEVDEVDRRVCSDEARLRQILINLLSNALKFTEAGKVVLKAERVGDDLVIRVLDTGIGIAPEDLEYIFDEFRQVDGSSTRKYQGTGLGLSITKKLVDLLGGQITVESVAGEGTTFTAIIPGVYILNQVSTPPSSPSPPSTVDGQTVVVIDDDPMVAVLLREELDEIGYRVVSAPNADEGVALVKKLKPLAVTVDIIMPGKDGWETISMLKGDPDTRDVPIIVLSASDNRELGLQMGVLDYLVKPIDRAALVSALERIPKTDLQDVLVVDDDPTVVELLVSMLELGGFKGRSAENGEKALVEIEAQVPGAILLDLMMPVMDGFQVIEHLQAHPEWKHIPVIVVTAKDLSRDEHEFLYSRVSQVVQKGNIDPDDLGETLKDLLWRYQK